MQLPFVKSKAGFTLLLPLQMIRHSIASHQKLFFKENEFPASTTALHAASICVLFCTIS